MPWASGTRWRGRSRSVTSKGKIAYVTADAVFGAREGGNDTAETRSEIDLSDEDALVDC